MSSILSTILEFALYILGGVALIVGIVFFALRNAEECPHPAECFNCSETSCQECSYRNPNLQAKEKAVRPFQNKRRSSDRETDAIPTPSSVRRS